jgi:hypothetical protein
VLTRADSPTVLWELGGPYAYPYIFYITMRHLIVMISAEIF